MFSWYAVKTKTRSEIKAKVNLENQGFNVDLPQHLKRRRHARRVDVVPTPFFPNYLFIGFDPQTSGWGSVNSTFGVSHLVGNGGSPIVVPDQIINDIQANEDENGWIETNQLLSYRKGDPVQIMSGPMIDSVGLFECTDDKKRALILLDLMGQSVKVQINMDCISAAS
mgnify:FL=1